MDMAIDVVHIVPGKKTLKILEKMSCGIFYLILHNFVQMEIHHMTGKYKRI